MRIQPYQDRSDKEYKKYIQFLRQATKTMDSRFIFTDDIIDRKKIEKPHLSQTEYLKIGSTTQGFKVIMEQHFDSTNNTVVASDLIKIQAYGLSNDLSLELISARVSSEPDYLELQIVAPDYVLLDVEKMFNRFFKEKPIINRKLTKEKLILDMSMKRKAWFIVEMRAKTMLKQFPKEPFILYALGIARAAQGDLDTGEDYLRKAIQFNPDFVEAIYNLSILYQKKSKHQQASDLLYKMKNLVSEEQPTNWLNI